jgi:hypothetical protein
VGQIAADVLAAARREDGGAYDRTRDSVMALLRAGETGHPGVRGVLRDALTTYTSTVSDRTVPTVAEGEFQRFTYDGVIRILARPGEQAEQRCDCRLMRPPAYCQLGQTTDHRLRLPGLPAEHAYIFIPTRGLAGSGVNSRRSHSGVKAA